MTSALSPRLLGCCSFISPGARVADIGCDHGYLGIHLLKKNIASFVYAADVRDGPLQCAVRNCQRYELQDKMSFFLSDGVQNVPRDFDTMVCAGMGADTMISILEAAPWLQNQRYTLILQCQSKTPSLRKYLSDTGFGIQKELALRDGRFLYTVMEVRYAPGHPLTAGGCFFPPAMADTPEAEAYRQQVIFRLKRAIAGQKEHADPVMVQALEELQW